MQDSGVLTLVAEVGIDVQRQSVWDAILNQGIHGNSIKIMADGGFDHLKSAIRHHLVGKGHDAEIVEALLSRLEKGDDLKEKISLASATDELIERCRGLGIAIDVVLRSTQENGSSSDDEEGDR